MTKYKNSKQCIKPLVKPNIYICHGQRNGIGGVDSRSLSNTVTYYNILEIFQRLKKKKHFETIIVSITYNFEL